jgi:Family of unknown function (DUF6335)
MKSRARRSSRDIRPVPKSRHRAVEEDGVAHSRSPTAVAAEALRTGWLPRTTRPREAIPGEGDAIRVGDPDDQSLANEYVGEETPGGTTPTPDQNGVDDIGRAYGLQEEDTGVLRSGAEVLERRDRHRSELRPPRRPLT